MKKIYITNEDKKEFRDTPNGRMKVLWMRLGIMIDFLSTLGISLLLIYSSYFYLWTFYLLLYLLLVIVVLGGEFIGTYYGALEQYVIDKNNKKELNYLDS